MDNSNLYKYYAFISYSRKDEKIVGWLHKELENYRIPTNLPKPDGKSFPPHIRPIFRDKTDLDVQPKSFVDQIVREIETSRYLIVGCSPNAARSRPDGTHYVDWEIREFIRSHGVEYAKDHILPVLISGNPNCGDPEKECLPPSLFSLGPDFLEHNFPSLVELSTNNSRSEDVKTMCIIDLVSFLIGVQKHIILDRYRQAQRERLKKIVILSTVVCLLLIGLTSWAFVERSISNRERNSAITSRNQAEEAKAEALLAKAQAEKSANDALASKNEALHARNEAEEKRKQAEIERQRADAQTEIAKQQKTEAEHQRGISDSTLQLVTGMFESIEPEVAKSHDVTVKEVMDRSTSDLSSGKLVLDPEVECNLRFTIGKIYLKLCDYSRALNQFGRFKSIMPGKLL